MTLGSLPVHYARHIAVDLARALGVLALIFLSFGHVPVTASAHGHDVLTATVDLSFCGDAIPVDRHAAHSPCHACRVLGVALPPPPSAAIEAPVAASPLAYFGACIVVATHLVATSARPRAPPALI